MSTHPGQHTSRLIALVVLLCAAAALVAYLGTRGGDSFPIPGDRAALPGVSLALPHDEPITPIGPHREVFQASCTVCHSTRLVMTQPLLSAKQWTAVVDKMVKAYGAELNEEQKHQVVAYLSAFRDDTRALAAK